jgi:hypothetical protein
MKKDNKRLRGANSLTISQLKLLNVFLAQRCYLCWLQLLLLESSSIPFFPDIPPKVDHDAVKKLPLVFLYHSAALAPVSVERSQSVYLVQN